MRTTLMGLVLLSVALAGAKPGSAAGLFAPGLDPELDQKMATHTRMLYSFHNVPFGILLTAEYRTDDDLPLIRQFLAQDATDDVQAVTGKTPFELIGAYEGGQGIGLRGGGAAISTAFRYMALKAEGAPAAVLAKARADVVAAIEGVHVAHVITGVKGRIARGIQRLKMDDGTPVPGSIPTLVPLFDDQGNPLPVEKTNDTSRDDNSKGVLPPGMWIWEDSCSKDQLDGWVLTMATLYDAALGDPDIDQGLLDRMRQDATEIGAMLREKHAMRASDGKDHEYDLVIMDADGRPTFHNDLNPLSIDLAYMPPGAKTTNLFNLVMALGIVKGLYHVSGDPEAEAFLYDELMGQRDYLGMMARGKGLGLMDYTYMDVKTNYSDVNMIAIALFLNIWFENDPEVLAGTRKYLEDRWWNVAGVKQTARLSKQPYYHALYLAMTDRGTDPALVAEAATLLKAWKLDPYLGAARVNCDEAELAAGSCLAVDGVTTIPLNSETNRGGWPIATEPLDPSIRPPSNFDARTDPFEVNGGGSGRGLMPGGDLNSAYWLLRWMPAQQAGHALRSANVRTHMGVGGKPAVVEPQPEPAVEPASETTSEAAGEAVDVAEVTADVVVDVTAAGDTQAGSGGGGCAASASGSAWALALPLVALLALRSRRRGIR